MHEERATIRTDAAYDIDCPGYEEEDRKDEDKDIVCWAL